ncbi:hypothetical protein TKK_0002516 [Trichogramma kaykai]
MLVDTGADVSVIPKELVSADEPTHLKLYKADGTAMSTYGSHQVIVRFNDVEPFNFSFIATNVPYPILGVDFIYKFKLLIDLHGKRLLKQDNSVFASGHCIEVDTFSLCILSPSQKYYDLLVQFPTIFDAKNRRSIKESTVCHSITTTGPPVSESFRKLSPEKLKAAQDYFDELERNDMVERSNSQWASAIHLVPKKDNTWRVCGDYRRLNAVTVPDKYPVKRLHDFSSILHDARVFRTLDLEKAFLQIPMRTEDRPKTALITPFGLYQFKVMTYGMRNAAQTFQRYANSVLGDLSFAFCYIDDILIASPSRELHRTHVKRVFERLRDAGLQLNLDKCHFEEDRVEFLGFLVDANGFKPLPQKVDRILDFPRPQTIDQLRGFLGMANFYHHCIPKCAQFQIALNKLLTSQKKKDKTPVAWTEEALLSFDNLKRAIADVSYLAFPKDDALLRVCTDASDIAMGAVFE